jgi:hypothetical protein
LPQCRWRFEDQLSSPSSYYVLCHATNSVGVANIQISCSIQHTMDPLSITASVIAVATIATQIGSAFRKLRSLCIELPGRLHALSNEVADLEIVLRQLAAVIEERSCLPRTAPVHDTIPQLLKQATTKLTQIRAIVEGLAETCSHRTIIVRAKAWRKHHGKLQALQDDVRTIKCSLNLTLGASNSYVSSLL